MGVFGAKQQKSHTEDALRYSQVSDDWKKLWDKEKISQEVEKRMEAHRRALMAETGWGLKRRAGDGEAFFGPQVRDVAGSPLNEKTILRLIDAKEFPLASRKGKE